jgi:hypothetical protein
MNDSINLNNLSIGAKVAAFVLGVTMKFMAPLWPFLAFMLVLVICDTATGRWAAKKRGEPRTPEKEGKVITKLWMYPLAVLLAQMMVITFFLDTPIVQSMTYVVALYICTLELRSNFRNIGEATGTDIWKVVAEWLTGRGKPAA